MRAASLKRKLEEQLRKDLRQIDKEILDYKTEEMRAFVGARCPRIVKFSRTNADRFTLGSGLRVCVGHDLTHVVVSDKDSMIGIFYRRRQRHGLYYVSHMYEDLELAKYRTKHLAENLPVINSLLNNVFPAWLEASKELDVESLMTSRVLRWISKQVGGQWPDIISGNFPLK